MTAPPTEIDALFDHAIRMLYAATNNAGIRHACEVTMRCLDDIERLLPPGDEWNPQRRRLTGLWNVANDPGYISQNFKRNALVDLLLSEQARLRADLTTTETSP